MDKVDPVCAHLFVHRHTPVVHLPQRPFWRPATYTNEVRLNRAWIELSNAVSRFSLSFSCAELLNAKLDPIFVHFFGRTCQHAFVRVDGGGTLPGWGLI